MKSLKGRAFVTFSSIFMVALFVTFLFVFNVVSRDLKELAINKAEYEIDSAVDNLNSQLEGMKKTYYSAAFSKRLINELRKPKDKVNYQMILSTLEELVYFSGNIHSIYLQDIKNNVCLSTETMSVNRKGSEWFRSHLPEELKKLRLIPTIDITTDYKPMFSYVGEMKIDFFGETVAYLSVNVLSHKMQQMIVKDDVYKNTIQFITDRNGTIIAQSENFNNDVVYAIDETTTNGDFIFIGNKRYLYQEGKADGDIRYIKLILEQDMYASIYKVAVILILSFGFFAIIILGVNNKLFDYLTEPIYELADKIKRYRQKDNEHVEFKTNRTDEFAYLFKSLEEMTVHINYLIDELYESNLYKKEMQLKLYRSGINPHFIFNILDSILWNLKFKDYQKVEKTLECFADFFRCSLRQHQDYVTIKETRLWIKSYCYLESYLKDDCITVNLMIDDSLDDVLIPSLLIQPVIENSFKYAFYGRNNGEITVVIEKNEHIVSVAIKDDGVGMMPEELSKILDAVETYDIHKTTKHFGLACVYQRLLLLYGEKPPFCVSSLPEEGTQVYFEIKV